MGFQGFENFGQNFAPLADAQLKQAYNDYQAQKELGQSQRQLQQDKIQAQEGAVKYGLQSPLANRIAVDPVVAKQLGNTETKAGEDPLAHMQDFIGQLNKQYPGIVDEKGTVDPAVYGHLMEMAKTQKTLEMKAAEVAQRRAADTEKMNQQLKNNLILENARNKNIKDRQSSAGKMSPQQKLVFNQIIKLQNSKYAPFSDPARIPEIDQEIERLKLQMNEAPQAPAPAAAPSTKRQVPDYKTWLGSAPDNKTNLDFYNANIAGK